MSISVKRWIVKVRYYGFFCPGLRPQLASLQKQLICCLCVPVGADTTFTFYAFPRNPSTCRLHSRVDIATIFLVLIVVWQGSPRGASS